MSKSLKKITKAVTSVVTVGAVGKNGWGSKAVGALSGGLVGDSSVYGESGGLKGVLGGGAAQATDNLAKTQMQIAQQQAERSSAEAAEQARASAQAIQLANDRSIAQNLANADNATDKATPEVQLAVDDGTSTARRRKFSSVSTSNGSSGPAIRI